MEEVLKRFYIEAKFQGKYLDVSHMDVDGYGTRIITFPSSPRSNKIVDKTLNIMSNNIENLNRAKEIVCGDQP